MTLDKYLRELADEATPLKHAGLLQFSGLSSEEAVEFRVTWGSLSQSRKCDVLAKLVELGEDNLELDFSAIFRSCLGDNDEEVREKAARGLWECDDRVVIRPLIKLLEKDPSPKVRAASAISLGKFAEMAQEGKLLARDGDRIREVLLEVIGRKHEAVEVQRRAIEAVASFSSPEIEQIIRETYKSGHPELKQSAIFAMGRSSNSQWLPVVLSETQQDDPALRYEAATACGQLGDESTVPHLIRLIEDEDFQVQLSAVQALGTIGGPLAKRALLQCLKMEDALEDAAQAALSSIDLDEDPLGFRYAT